MRSPQDEPIVGFAVLTGLFLSSLVNESNVAGAWRGSGGWNVAPDWDAGAWRGWVLVPDWDARAWRGGIVVSDWDAGAWRGGKLDNSGGSTRVNRSAVSWRRSGCLGGSWRRSGCLGGSWRRSGCLGGSWRRSGCLSGSWRRAVAFFSFRRHIFVRQI